MDFEKNDAAVGAFLVLAAAAFAAALLFVNGGRLFSKSYPLSIELPEIAGIDKGAEVLYRGYKAGEVTRVAVTYAPQFRFVVHFVVKSDIRLPPGTRVLVRGKGFTGGRFLDLDAPAGADARSLPPGTVLPVELEPDLMAKANDVLGEARTVVRRFSEKGTAEDAAMAVREARGAMTELRKTLANANALMEEDRAALHRLLSRSDELLARREPEIDRSLKNLDASLARLPAITANLEEMTADLKKRPWRLVRKGN
jgi:ABC-type transporter Mla subunit MlaD